MRSYYYTIDEPRAVKHTYNGFKGWKLSINYNPHPEIKHSKPRLRRNQVKYYRADSNIKQFRLPDQPVVFSSEEEAVSKKKEFRDLVENVVRGDRPLKTHYFEQTEPMPPQLARSRQATSVMAQRAWRRMENQKIKRALRFQRRVMDWQNWCDESIVLLQSHIEAQTTILLLNDPPTKNMKVSCHLHELTQKKVTMVMLFLKFLLRRDAFPAHFETGGTHASVIAAEVAELLGSSSRSVYRAYGEWRAGEQTIEDDGVCRPGAFFPPLRGSYERRFLLHEEDFQLKFKKWMRKTLRKLSKELAWKYLNETLLKEVDEATLRAHNIILPISKGTAYSWMLKCSAARCDTKKTTTMTSTKMRR